MLAPSFDRAETFAANRAHGRIGLTVEARDGRTRRRHVSEAGSLRVRFPAPAARALEAVIVNTAGGIAGGDRFDIDVTAGEQASLAVTTTAAEKVYRSLGPDADIRLRLAVERDATLLWLPQETILFDRARLRRTIDVELDESATLILGEPLVFGRAAMGETVQQGRVFDRWRLRRGGRLVFAETMRLDDASGATLNARAVAAGATALATLLIVPADTAHIAPVRECAGRHGEVAVSAWNGFAVARFLAHGGAALRHDLVAAFAALGVTPPRLWLG